MTLIQTHPEFAIVCQILQQASIPIPTRTLFDEQWNSDYLQQCFRWTHHLSTLLLSGSRPTITAALGQYDNDFDEPLDAMEAVKSFLETVHQDNVHFGENSHGDKGGNQSAMAKGAGATRLGTLPTQDEMLDPSAALRTRLLKNPGLSDTARMQILCFRDGLGIQPRRASLPQDALAVVNNNAVEDLIDGVRSHFLRLERMEPSLTQGVAGDAAEEAFTSLSTETIERKAKARAIFYKISDPSNPLSIHDAIRHLGDYLRALRSEALEVIGYLLDMAPSAGKEPSRGQSDTGNVDWRAFSERIARLVQEDDHMFSSDVEYE